MSENNIEAYFIKKRELEELEEKFKNFTFEFVPPEEKEPLRELMEFCFDIERKALEEDKKNLNLP